jgi:hypothetical protein
MRILICPWNRYLFYSMRITLNMRNIAFNDCGHLTGIRVPPSTDSVIVNWFLFIAFRAMRFVTLGVSNLDGHRIALQIKLHTGNIPWTLDPKYVFIELNIVHG